jgi:CDP-diacylglycerol---glycerol-3-phosphate 3-phosphatidyltransferase
VPAMFRHAFRLREFAYPANLLTLARLLMLPTVIRSLRQPDGRWRALGVLGVAMLTDALDGPVARRRHEVSALGKVLDPIVDKIMINTMAVTLSQTRGFPWWATGLLFARDLGILVGAALVYRRRAELTIAHPTGKATTLALTAAMLCYIGDGDRSGRPALYLALLPFLVSVAVYGRQFWRYVMRGMREDELRYVPRTDRSRRRMGYS